MSLQMVDASNPRTRAELRERIKGLFDSMREYAVNMEADQETRLKHLERVTEEIKCLYFALCGYCPTGDEMQEVTGG